MADVDPEVERAVRRHDLAEAGFRQLGQQQRAVGGVDLAIPLQFVDAVEGTEGRDLRDRGG